METYGKRAVGTALTAAAAIFALACGGDGDVTQRRGFTKAPLENANVFYNPDPTTDMDELGEPVRHPAGRRAGGEAGGTEAAAAGEPTIDAAALPEGATMEMVEAGRVVFAEAPGVCVSCHGANARGTPLGPDLADQEWLNLDQPTLENIATLIRTGVPSPEQFPGVMPPMGGASLSAEQLQAVAAYVYAISHGS